ncbi:MAG TPA: IclR family transcriptional regulator [Actinomycetota bacterium]
MTVSRARAGVDRRAGRDPIAGLPGAGPVSTGVGVLDRSVEILRAVDDGARTLAQLVAATGLTRTTAFRLVKALEAHGLLRAEGGDGYRLGPLLRRLGVRAAADAPLAGVAHPVLERLTLTTGESSQLYVRAGDVRVCVASVESPNELRTIVAVGAELPLARGSAGKVLLAFSPQRDRDRFRGQAADPERFDRELAIVRRRGWAQSAEEREPGVGSVSAPVFGAEGDVAAAVSVSGPVARLRGNLGRRYAAAVVAAARDIERTLGVDAAERTDPRRARRSQDPGR